MATISKQLSEINTFSYGIIAKPDDERDAPAEGAVKSLNIEPLADGELRGIPTDLSLRPTGFNATVSTLRYEQGGIINTNPSYANTSSKGDPTGPPNSGN